MYLTQITTFRWLISPPSDDLDHHLQITHITTFRWLISPPSDNPYHHLQMTHITTFRWLISPPSDDPYHHLQMTHIFTFRWPISPPSDDPYHHLQMTHITTFCSLATNWIWDWKKLVPSEGGDMGRRLVLVELLSELKKGDKHLNAHNTPCKWTTDKSSVSF